VVFGVYLSARAAYRLDRKSPAIWLWVQLPTLAVIIKKIEMVISKETLALISAFKNPILDALKDIKDEVKFYFDTGIVKYVDSIREKFIKTKTFLYRLETVNFYDIYFPITLRHLKQIDYKIDEIEGLFENSNFISIIGNAGSGKSMLLKHVFLKSIMQVVKIPIVVELISR